MVGKSIKGKITATKPGHKNNTNFAKKLKQIMIEDMNKTAPEINFDEAPIITRKKLKQFYLTEHHSYFLMKLEKYKRTLL